MKYSFFIFFVFLATLLGCNQSSKVSDTHTHDSECSETHEGKKDLATQESFEVTVDSLSGETKGTDAHGHKHDHGDHSHTH